MLLGELKHPQDQLKPIQDGGPGKPSWPTAFRRDLQQLGRLNAEDLRQLTDDLQPTQLAPQWQCVFGHPGAVFSKAAVLLSGIHATTYL